MFEAPTIPGLEDETNQRLMADLLLRRGVEIKEGWAPEIENVRQAIRESGTNYLGGVSKIDRIAEKVGDKLGIRMDSGGTDVGARGRQVVLNVLAEILNKDEGN